MLLGDLMAASTIDPSYAGILTNDDFVLAINIGGSSANIDDYAVVQGAIEGVDAQMSPATNDKQYLRAGMSTTKTGTQRTFKATGDRYVGDDFQDYVFSHEVKYGVGEKVVTDYVWFCLLNGKGEKGKVAIIVNSDSSGTAGNTAAVDIDLRKTGDMPIAYTYAASGAPTLGELTVVSVAGTLAGDTAIYVNPVLGAGNSYKYKVDSAAWIPAYDEVLTTGWTDWDGIDEITAASDTIITIAEVETASNKAKKAGSATVIAA